MIRLFTAWLLVLLLFVACGDDYDKGTRHPSQHTHTYDDHDHDHSSGTSGSDNHQTLQDKYQDVNFESSPGADSGNRWIWQKPNLILDKLQPLEGKVVADIGAGPYGYFSLRIAYQMPVKKIIAMDIDPVAIKFMEKAKKLLPEGIIERFETRLVESDNAKLEKEEADVVLIVNTAIYFENRVEYFRSLYEGISPGGKIVIIDFKKRSTPVGPPMDERVPLGQMEQDLKNAGYKKVTSDDRSLDYQYIIMATKK